MILKLADVKIKDICEQLDMEIEMHMSDISTLPTFDDIMLWLNGSICINIDADANNQIRRMYLGSIEQPIGIRFKNKELQERLQDVYDNYVEKAYEQNSEYARIDQGYYDEPIYVKVEPFQD